MRSIYKPKWLLFVAVALFLSNAVMFRHGTDDLSESFGWVVHTLQVQAVIHQLQPEVGEFSQSVRNNWTAPASVPVRPSLPANLMLDVDRIQELTRDNRSQQKHIEELRTLLAAQAAIPARTALQPRNVAFENEIDENTRGIMRLLGVMDAEEGELLQQRQRRPTVTEKRINLALIAETSAQSLVAVTFFFFYSRSKRRKAVLRQANREIQATLTSVLECTTDCVVTLGHDWTILYGNRRTLESFPDFKLNTDYWSCFPDIAGAPAEGQIRNAMVTREPVKFEHFYLPYGSWYKVQIFPSDAGLNIFSSDITEEKTLFLELELEQILREKRIEALSAMTTELARVNELLTSVMDSSSDGIIKISRSWAILFGNRAARESFAGFEVDVDFWACFPALLSTHAEERLKSAMNDRVVTQFEISYGPYSAWYSVHVFPTVDGVSVFFRNVTAEKELENQLECEQLLREKRIEALSHMAGGLAHEISNPLAIIHGRATELRDMAVGEVPLAAHDVRVVCDDIVKTSKRASTILRGLRGFAREASQDQMKLASIHDIAEECVELQHSRFDRHNVEIQVSLDPDLPPLLCRETQIGQILTNLLNNAFDAIMQSESVERWVRMTGANHAGTIVIEVTDSGPGVEDHFKTHLMEAFFTTKEFGLGMGVGLCLSRAIAQDHGGTLILCADRKNTCFQLTLPIAPDLAEPDAEPVLAGVSH